ncbi:hypothetical protein F9L06_25940 [Brucella anthropi]|uniref:Uncharacterized protein n=1 Tax=Brucella anthropi TaxID=529 RepID=A0A6I0DIJ5_BRUAN|nr:hypothetical protein [Brucella anthropi]KAB2788964.1 hypothetical protein F9L06_25940 [Brucella anthropi]
MATKKTGLAAFTRSKGTESTGDTMTETARASVEIPTPRRKRGGGETVALTVKVRRSDWQRLRQLADAEGTTIQAMAEAGFSAVLGEHGLPPIEPYSR